MFPWRQWLRKSLARSRRRPGRRPTFRLTLEALEERTLPSAVFPFVQSINRLTPTGPLTSAATVSYAVTFSEPVTGVDPTDFKLVSTGTVGTTLTQVTPFSASVYTVTVSGITGRGTLGLNLVDDGSIRDLAGDPLTQQNARAVFKTRSLVQVFGGSQSVVLGDVNGDGKLDLAITINGNGEVGVLLGNGNGTFQADLGFSTGSDPFSVALGDVNGDGRPDLVVANYSSNTLSVILNAGNGTFQAQQAFATGSGPFSVALADVNGDGKPDLVVANFSFHTNTVSVLLNNGNGTFQTQQTFAVGSQPDSIAVGDFNGDGIPDIAVANAGSNTVSVLLGTGHGTFQAQRAFATGLSPYSVAVADVNGDGKPDLVVANTDYRTNSVSILLGNGNGTFQTQQTFATGYRPISMAVDDLNGDGKPDIAVTNRNNNTVSVLLGNGNGTFQAQQTFATGATPLSVAFGDVNGDGRPDLVVADQSSDAVSVFLNAGNGDFTGQTYDIDTITPYVVSINRATPAGTVTNASSVSFTVTFSKPVTGVDPTDFQLATTGTVGTTLTQVTQVSSSVYTVTVSGITGNGTLGLNLVDDGSIGDLAGHGLINPSGPAVFQVAQFLQGSNNEVYSVAVADINGDGKPDLIIDYRGAYDIEAFLGNGDGTFRTQTKIATGDKTAGMAVVDVNGDHTPDLIVASDTDPGSIAVYLGNGDGKFQSPVTFATVAYPQSVAIAEVNGDSIPDLVTDSRDGNVSVLLGNGNGTFQQQTSFATGNVPRSATVVDVNNDGKPDLEVVNTLNGSVSVFLGNGNGTFQNQLIFGTGTFPDSVAVADVNGDGKPDLVVTNLFSNQNQYTGVVSVLLGNGDGTFQPQSALYAGSFPETVAVADVNGDGKPDVIVVNQHGNSVSVLLNNGSGAFQSQDTFAAGTYPYSLAVADLNNDGKSDIVVADVGSNGLTVLRNADGDFTGQAYTIDTIDPYVVSINRASPAGPVTNATSVSFTVTFSEPVTGVDPTDFKLALGGSITATTPVVVTGDGAVYTVTISGISGAGTLELNLVDDGSIHDLAGNPLVQANQGATFQSQITVATGPTGRLLAVADVNGDGKADLIVANQNNTFGVLLGNGNGTFQSQATLASGAYYSGEVVDVNGDGKPDLVVTSPSGSTVGVLLGNGDGSFQSQMSFATSPSPRALAVADVNGDGKQDLLVTTSTGVDLLLGNGDGTFQTPVHFGITRALSVALADVNGDGKPDLILGFQQGITVLLGNGNGTFQKTPIFGYATKPYALEVADVNGDGKPDLVFANHGVSVLLGNGDGTFQKETNFPTGSVAFSLALADINGDGKLDAVVPNDDAGGYGSVRVLMGNGDGTFQMPTNLGSYTNAGRAAVADLNGDGRPDIVVNVPFNQLVSVFLNSSNGDFTGQNYTIDTIDPFVVSINRADASPTNAGTLHFTVTFSEPVTGVDSGDFQLVSTGTVGTTLTQVTPVSASVYTVTVSGITGNGTLGLNLVDDRSIRDLAGNGLTSQNAASFDAPQFFDTYSPFDTSYYSPHSVALGDLNGDGKPDLAIASVGANGAISILLGNGNGSFQVPQHILTSFYPNSIALDDLNGDGKLDLAFTAGSDNVVGTLLGNGNGTFQAQKTIATGSFPTSFALGDINGDGKLDLVVGNSGSHTVSVLLGNGDGTFQAQSTFATGKSPGTSPGVGSGPFSVVLGDMNGDGRPDLAVGFGYSIGVLLGNGNGTFQTQRNFNYGIPTPYALALGDVNGDGRPDLVSSSLLTVSVLLGNGNGDFQTAQHFRPGGDRGLSLVIGDVNGDGIPDLTVADQGSDTVSVLLGIGDGTFRAPQIFPAGSDPLSVVLGDINGDGRTDLVIATASSPTVTVLLGNDNGDFTGQTYTRVNTAGTTHFVVTATPSITADNIVTFTVTAEDQFNHVATAYGGTVAFSGSDSAGTLPSSGTLTNGVGVFSATLITAGSQSLIATDTLFGGITGKATVRVSAAFTTHFSIITSTNTTTAGVPFVIGVIAEDQFGNIATGYGGIVHFSGTDSQAVLPADGTLTSGIGFFPVILKTAGSQIITASNTTSGNITGTSDPIVVSAARASHFLVSAALPTYPGVPGGPTSFASTGMPFRFTVTALDPFGNTVPQFAGTVHLTSSDSAAKLPGEPATLVAGLGIFSATLMTPGNQTVAVVDTVSGITGTSGPLATRGLVVTSFTPTTTGFTVTFNKPFNPQAVNLYTAGSLPDDVILATTGSQVGVRGSVLFDASDAGFTFVKTDTVSGTGAFNPASGLLAAGKYTLTLRSFGNGGGGFEDTLGGLLDGTNSGSAGGNFQVTFSVGTPPVAVGIPDFARGFSNTDAISITAAPSGFLLPDASIYVVFNGQTIPFALNGTYMKEIGTPTATSITLAMDYDFGPGSLNFDNDLTMEVDLQPNGEYSVTATAREDDAHQFSLIAPNGATLTDDFQLGTTFVLSSPGVPDGGTFWLSYTNPAANPSTGTAMVTFSTDATILQNNIQTALNTGSLAPQIGIGPGGVPNAQVFVTSDSSAGATVYVAFQSMLVTATSQVLTSTTSRVDIFPEIDVANNILGSGIPITMSSFPNATSGSFTLQYNPSLLSITGVSRGFLSARTTLVNTINNPTSATAVISFFAPGGGNFGSPITLGGLLATIPVSATADYGATQLLHFSAVQLNGTAGPIPVTSRDAVQVAAYFGDVLGAGGPLSLLDAANIAALAGELPNTAAQTVPGFAAFPNLDPAIIGDVSLQGTVNFTDAGAMTQEIGGTQRATIPYVPVGLQATPQLAPGISPTAIASPTVHVPGMVSSIVAGVVPQQPTVIAPIVTTSRWPAAEQVFAHPEQIPAAPQEEQTAESGSLLDAEFVTLKQRGRRRRGY